MKQVEAITPDDVLVNYIQVYIYVSLHILSLSSFYITTNLE